MRILTKFAVLSVLALWSLAVMHCKLESLPGLAFLKSCCYVEPASDSSDSHCDTDGCSAVEDGGYRMEEQTVSAPAPELLVLQLSAVLEISEPAPAPYTGVLCLAPPDLPHSWQFRLRMAAPPRAPAQTA